MMADVHSIKNYQSEKSGLPTHPANNSTWFLRKGAKGQIEKNIRLKVRLHIKEFFLGHNTNIVKM